MPRSGLPAFFLLSAAVAVPGSGGDAPGPAPALELEEVIRGPAEIRLEELRGQALVVDFWATWCAPCVAQIPHWNDLVRELAGEPVRFLSVSDEPSSRVRPFLEDHPIDGWVGLDTDRSAFEAYRVVAIPVAALIDREGALRAVTEPRHLTVEALRELVAGRTPDLPEPMEPKAETLVGLDPDGAPAPLFEAVIRPSSADSPAMQVGPGVYVSISGLLASALEAAFETSRPRMALEVELPDQRFDFVFRTGRDRDLLTAVLQWALTETFDLEITREVRQAEVLVLRALEGELSGLWPSAAGYQISSLTAGRMQATGVNMPELAERLESGLGRVVIDGTGLEGRYDLELQWDPAEREGLQKALERETGLQLVPDRREVETVVVRSRGG